MGFATLGWKRVHSQQMSLLTSFSSNLDRGRRLYKYKQTNGAWLSWTVLGRFLGSQSTGKSWYFVKNLRQTRFRCHSWHNLLFNVHWTCMYCDNVNTEQCSCFILSCKTTEAFLFLQLTGYYCYQDNLGKISALKLIRRSYCRVRVALPNSYHLRLSARYLGLYKA